MIIFGRPINLKNWKDKTEWIRQPIIMIVNLCSTFLVKTAEVLMQIVFILTGTLIAFLAIIMLTLMEVADYIWEKIEEKITIPTWTMSEDITRPLQRERSPKKAVKNILTKWVSIMERKFK